MGTHLDLVKMAEGEERAVYKAIPWTGVGKSVKKVVVVVDMVGRGEYSRIAILSLIRSGEIYGCHTAAQVVLAVVVEVDSRSRTQTLSVIDFRNLTGTG